MDVQAQVKVLSISCDEDKVRRAGPGENLRVRLSGIEEDDILSGFVLSSIGAYYLIIFHVYLVLWMKDLKLPNKYLSSFLLCLCCSKANYCSH